MNGQPKGMTIYLRGASLRGHRGAFLDVPVDVPPQTLKAQLRVLFLAGQRFGHAILAFLFWIFGKLLGIAS